MNNFASTHNSEYLQLKPTDSRRTLSDIGKGVFMDIKEATIIMDQVIEDRSDGIESRAWEIVKSHLPTTNNSDYAKCLESVKELTNGQRYSLFYKFCIGCGSDDPHCQCWNDE